MGGGAGPQSHVGTRTPKAKAHPEWGVQDEGSGESYGSHDSDDEKPKIRKRNRFQIQTLELHFRRLRASINRPHGVLLMTIFVFLICGSFTIALYRLTRSSATRSKLILAQEGALAEAPYKHVYSLPYPAHMFDVQYTVHVLIPLYNAEEFIVESVESALRQSHSRTRVWVYNDGSTDSTSALLNIKFRADPRVTLLSNKVNLGPSETKWLGFRAIAKEALPNDIVVVVDGDDYLLTDEALTTIHKEHVDKKAWFTYGSYIGPFSKEVKGLDSDTHHDFRNSAWRYGHPRSFKAFLIEYLTDADFKQADGTWLTKGTDRGFIYRFMELAGPSRISFIRSPIYYYRKHASNTWSLIPKESKMAQLNHLNSLPHSQLLEEDIHVFMVTWGRVHILHDTIQSLVQQQTVSHRVKLHIWNNNMEIKDQVDAIVSLFPADTIDVIHSKLNLYSYSRFLHIKKVMLETLVDYVVIVDDDQQFAPDYLERLWADKKPRTFTSWWGRRFRGQAYFKGSPDYRELAQGLRLDIMDFDYAGPGGCVIDANAFVMPATLAIPQRFSTLDDLWLSYVMHMAGWHVRRTLVRPRTITDDKTTSVALWSRLKDHKDEFLTYLREGGWNV